MNRLRVFVLILVSLLLPLRGAVAAAMQCEPARAPAHGHVHADAGEHAQAHSHAGAQAHTHGHAQMHTQTQTHAAGEATGHHDDGAGCSNCASGCCAPCMVGPSLQVLQAPLPRGAAFPPLAAPPARFLSEGPERPPRAA